MTLDTSLKIAEFDEELRIDRPFRNPRKARKGRRSDDRSRRHKRGDSSHDGMFRRRLRRAASQ